MIIPTEPIGSIPRPLPLIEAFKETDCDDPKLDPLYQEALVDTIKRFEATGSPVISDGEQRKFHTFRKSSCGKSVRDYIIPLPHPFTTWFADFHRWHESDGL